MSTGEARRNKFVRALIRRDRSIVESLAWMAGLALAPTALRMTIDTGALGLPFLTYWPSLLIASLVLELRFAIVFAAVTALFAQRMFGGGAWFYEVTPARVVFFAMFAMSAGMIVAMGSLVRRAVRDVEEAHAAQEQYSREMRHRVRNMLTMIQALATRGAKARSALDFYKEFSLRIEGLANSTDLLQIGAETDGRLPQLAGQTVAPFDRDGRIRLSGEPCKLPADSCIPLIMTLHELCSNAISHGALSNETGRVDLNWFLGPDGSTLYVMWTERGGPRVVPPAHSGMGSKLLVAQPGIAAIDLNFDPAGVWCEIRIEGARAVKTSVEQRTAA